MDVFCVVGPLMLRKKSRVSKWRVAHLPLRERLGPDVEVNLALCDTNTHLSIIHTHTHTYGALRPPLSPVDGV